MKNLMPVLVIVAAGVIGSIPGGTLAAPITYDFTGPTAGTNVDLGQSETYTASGGPNIAPWQGHTQVPRPPVTTPLSIPRPAFIWSGIIAAPMSRVWASAAPAAATATAVILPGKMARSISTERRLSDWISP